MDRHQQDSVLEGITVSCTPQEQKFDSPLQTTAVCESLELQVGDCETVVESKTEESHFEKSGGGRFPNHGLQKQCCSLVDSAIALFGFGPAPSTICQRTGQGSCLPVPHITGLLNSILAMDHEVAGTQHQLLLATGPACLRTGQETCLAVPLRQAF